MEPTPPPPVPDGWKRCHTYMEKKGRFCRQHPMPNSNFCGNHQTLQNATTGANPVVVNSKPTSKKRKRIPCPLDPSHDIYEDMLSKHILICPQVKKKQKQQSQPFYRHNCNISGHGQLLEKSLSQPSMERNSEWAKRVAIRVLQVHQLIFSSTNNSTQKVLTEREIATLTLQDIQGAIPLEDLSQNELQAGLEDSIRSYRIKSGGIRHIHQQASLLAHLRRHLHPKDDQKITIVELGAGRGMLGLLTAGVFHAERTVAPNNNKNPLDFVMIERTGSRSKADTVLRNNSNKIPPANSQQYKMHFQGLSWSRVECDLAHIDMPALFQDKTNVVAIAKHLCGAGTDLALKALYPIRHCLTACSLATCCHGICSWETYVGRDFLRSQMEADDNLIFGREEFDLLRAWSAGTASSHPTSHKSISPVVATSPDPSKKELQVPDDDPEHKVKMMDECPKSLGVTSVVESLDLACGVQGLGRACQRLIDYGRVEYIQKEMFPNQLESLKLCHYVPPHITPQNALIICKRTPCCKRCPV